MFSGLVTAVGRVAEVDPGEGGLRLRIAAGFEDLVLGESIAVDGACLTVTGCGPGWFTVQVVATSLDRTLFGSYRAGREVNLERALRMGDRLGGHLVQGHVDGVGRVRAVDDRGDARVVELEAPEEVARVAVPQGSVTLDGVSVTVVARPAPRLIRVSLIPFTLQQTTLGRLAPGTEVHLEGDLIGKYVKELLQASGHGRPGPGV